MTPTYRICVSIDVDANSIDEAYSKVDSLLSNAPSDIGWESSDEEWFNSYGEQLDEEEISAVRLAHIGKKSQR